MKKIFFLGLFLCLSLISHAQIINFSDSNFKTALLNHSPAIDLNRDGQITTQEAHLVKGFNVSGKNIRNLSDIKYFINLERFSCSGNNLTSLDLRNNTKLKSFDAVSCSLTSINLDENTELYRMNCMFNKLTTLNLSNNTKLKFLVCDHNEITNLDLSNNINIETLHCNNNEINKLTLNSRKLTSLHCNVNKIEALDVTKAINLKVLAFSNNRLININLLNNINLEKLYAGQNKLNSIDARNCSLNSISLENNPNLTLAQLTGQKFKIPNREPFDIEVNLEDCPNLSSVCIDNEFITPLKERLNEYSPNTNPRINEFCDYGIIGKSTYATTESNCNINNIGFTSIKYLVTSLSNAPLEIFPDNSGQFIADVSQGSYSLIPIIENPNYFNINPRPTFPPQSIRFPQDGTNVTKNFCITPKGGFNDLEIILIPTGKDARPGFEASYTITYKNKGTTTQSGTVTLDYFQEILNFKSSVPSVTRRNGNKLTWVFTNLRPSEIRKINLSFSINKPTDNPAVNTGDILSYNAIVNGSTTDETPENNSITLNQTVVNSFDPNDKICLEGNEILSTSVGGYLHYMIRFENKGTASAINIRIEDDIDTSRLDIDSFIPLEGSHPFTTKINNKKQVEFLFNNINLPFDDANNDGYVLFKIKTKQNLSIGNFIDNKAAIYFDFNSPIITNTQRVTITNPVDRNAYFDRFFALSQNPTKGKITLLTKQPNIIIEYIRIDDLGGNLVGYFPGNNSRTMDLSYLFANIHFMTVKSNLGTFSVPFVKID